MFCRMPDLAVEVFLDGRLDSCLELECVETIFDRQRATRDATEGIVHAIQLPAIIRAALPPSQQRALHGVVNDAHDECRRLQNIRRALRSTC